MSISTWRGAASIRIPLRDLLEATIARDRLATSDVLVFTLTALAFAVVGRLRADRAVPLRPSVDAGLL